MCKVTDGYAARGSPCFSTTQNGKKRQQKKQSIKNDLLTFPEWIICTGVLMTSLDFFSAPLLSKVAGAV